jgi:hypothetical protein
MPEIKMRPEVAVWEPEPVIVAMPEIKMRPEVAVWEPEPR